MTDGPPLPPNGEEVPVRRSRREENWVCWRVGERALKASSWAGVERREPGSDRDGEMK